MNSGPQNVDGADTPLQLDYYVRRLAYELKRRIAADFEQTSDDDYRVNTRSNVQNLRFHAARHGKQLPTA